MTDSSHDDLLEMIAEEISRRVRQGERPQLAEYAERVPHLASRLKDLLPALLALEAVAKTPPTMKAYLSGRFGDYTLIRAVGRGAMGTVYEAVQHGGEKRVALKVLHEPESATGLARFQREARAAGKLQHPHIVPVYGIGEDQGRPYYAMQFIAGAGLNRLLDRARLERQNQSGASNYERVREACGIIAQVAEGVAHAHERGVLHRDIKPANILIDADRNAWVIDFGLAREDDDQDSLKGMVVGTVRYMAPERLRGANDPRCDVYALGLTLYEAVTLRPAFQEAEGQELIEAIGSRVPPSPRQIDASVPRDLEAIILKAIAREPADRYETASEFAGDLKEFLEGRPIAAWRPTVFGKFRRKLSEFLATARGAVDRRRHK